jgi:small ligand-binding sensory domain FIST
MDALLDAFNGGFPGIPVVGGMASGASAPGGHALLTREETLRSGAAGVSLAGALGVDVIVSQGCRAIGPVFEVTEAKENVLIELGGKPALTAVHSMVENLPQEDRDLRDLLRHGLFLGRSISEGKGTLGRGDFLIRSVVGVDQGSGTISVGDYLSEGERVQFHVRDGATAKEDLEMMLSLHALIGRPRGAFLFSCNGRGTHLYGHSDGDISVIQDYLGGVPLAGFFCAGEIGPIGGRNFLHGHTASLALIRSTQPRPERGERSERAAQPRTGTSPEPEGEGPRS